MLKNKIIGLIGSGNMGEAIVGGLIAAKATDPKNIICADIRAKRLQFLKETYGVKISSNNTEVAKTAEVLIYAIKPQMVASVLMETADFIDMSKLVISVAAGVPLAAIEKMLDKETRLIRVMPNIAALVKEAASAMAAGKNANPADTDIAMTIFSSIGKTVLVKETAMDAVTGLSGSGPAYIFIVVDALADAGVKMGLSREEASFLATQTVLGAARLIFDSGEHPGQLKDKVSSPGGTTIAGIHALENGGIRNTLINAVEAATKRSQELGQMTAAHFSEPQ